MDNDMNGDDKRASGSHNSDDGLDAWIDGLAEDIHEPGHLEALNEQIDDALRDEDFDVFGDAADDGLVFSATASWAGTAGSSGARGAGPSPGQPPHRSGPTLPPPPPSADASQPERLVRDPNGMVGGVASGLAHYLGIDVTLVRVMFVVGTLFFGLPFVLYPFAWMIIPAASVWPPAGSTRRHRRFRAPKVTKQELGLALAVIGLLVFTSRKGGASEVILPLVLGATGFWLLKQPPAEDAAVGTTAATAVGLEPDLPLVGQPILPDDYAETTADTYGRMGYDPGVPPAPVAAPTRSRGRRLLRGILGVALIVPILVAGFLVIVLTAGSGAEFGERTIQPRTVAEIESTYALTAGSLDLDFTHLDASMFTEPIDVEVNITAGELNVRLPENLPVSIDAHLNAGELRVLDDYSEGLNNDFTIDDDDAVLILDVNGTVGDFNVARSVRTQVLEPSGSGDR